MAVLEILTYPNPLLKQTSAAVEQIDEQVLAFIADLEETLNSFPGCVGIAAPQTGMLKRIIAIDVSRNRKPVANNGPMVLINPRIEWQEGEEVAREGCLSIPDFTANVRRASRIRCSAISPGGTPILLETSGFEARVILHEADHLDGYLFLDRVTSLKTDVFRRKRYAVPEPSASAATGET